MSESLQAQENGDEKLRNREEVAGHHLESPPVLDRQVSVQESVTSDNEVFADAVEHVPSNASEVRAGSVTGDENSASPGSDSPTIVDDQQLHRELMDGLREPPQQVNGVKELPKSSSDADPEAQAMVIASLRAQVQDLFSQVTQLNNKLVQSYDRMSDVEDDLHIASSNLRASSLKVSQLELERTQHLAALNTGLLVERTHVTGELTRLMEKATEEAARRGQAESARAEIEKDLDDLSASLFGQANTMVAEARLARAVSERKVEEAEQALRGAEEAVTLMQQQMQALQEEKELAVMSAEEMKFRMGKGKWVDREQDPSVPHPYLRLLSLHTPYQEFLLFVAHLRNIRPASPAPPSMSSLLPLPFIARLVTEDTDPTLRFDIAPALNWLSRRSIISAIHNGQLSIEPMATNALLQESSFPSPGLPGSSSNAGVSCALCGTSIIASHTDSSHLHPKPPQHNKSSLSLSRTNTAPSMGSSWSAFLSKNPLASTTASTPPTPPPQDHIMPGLEVRSSPQSHPQSQMPTQIYVFRLAVQTQSSQQTGQTGLSITARSGNPTVYPLCQSSWCLTRLRTTCSLWAFVKSGVVDKVWEEEVPTVAETGWEVVGGKDGGLKDTGARSPEKPPVPPRRRGLWERASSMASSALGNSSKDKDKEQEKKLPATPPADSSPTSPVNPPPRPPLPQRSKSRLMASPTQEKVAAPALGVNPLVNDEVTAADKSGSDQTPQAIAASSDSEPKPDELPNATETSENATAENGREPTQTTVSDTGAGTSSDSAAAVEKSEVPSVPAVRVAESAATESSEEASNVAPTESNTNDTAVAPPVLTSIHDAEKPPSRTGSPAPPPIPRRAAARARPVSVAIPATASGPNSAVTPSRETGGSLPDTSEQPAAGTESGLIGEPQSSEDKTESQPAEESTLAKESNSQEESEPQESKPREDAEPREEPKLEEEPEISASSASDPQDIDPSPSKEQEDTTAADPAPPVDSTPTVSEPAQAAVPTDSSGQESNVPQATELSAPATVSEKVAEEDLDKAGLEVGPFIGDATWEERTWKEIVRLKEDMFWARIGCLR
ncbi:hypothetical protein OE88DRAFT_1739156 [Heliocybe sulcata]|uniref:GDP/GTP exchange factor Sec2 N-terminal domain-containing protein n=1 Tax=Heliocybe sulcata TaxID=5364 RepID=A0A5C3MPL1_9AGAM|nr:hypothetical protein OE88DRAFT_1739156 [Heliocybe sulcata]